MNIFAWISLILQIIPLVTQIIQQIEIPGNGPAKRETVIALVLEALKASLLLTGGFALTDQQIQFLASFIGTVVDSIVGLFNKTGQFKHTTSVVVNPA